MSKHKILLTEKQLELLDYLYRVSTPSMVFSVKKTQSQIAKELGITRQALSMHLRKMKELGLIRTGRGFIDLTEEVPEVLGLKGKEAFVFIKVQPSKRDETYQQLKKLPALHIYRVTGEIDVIAIVPQDQLEEFLNKVSKVEGIISTSSHIVIEALK